jgi:hypothetical protein
MTNQNRNFRDINRRMQEDASGDDASRSSEWQKILNDEAPPIAYLGTSGPCNFILVPPHPTHGASQAMTSGGVRGDEKYGYTPTLGQYGLDHVLVYRKVGNNPDRKKRRDILAINIQQEGDGSFIQVEREWGKGYRSPMYKLYDYLWRTAGGYKFDKQVKRMVSSIQVDPRSAKVRRALELCPPNDTGGPDSTAAIARGKRTLLLNGFLVSNIGKSYTVDEDNQPCWPQQRVLMINQVTGIKSPVNARDSEGFYDMWFRRTDGIDLSLACDEAYIRENFGDIYEDVDAQLAWEAGFLHSDFASVQKLVTWSSYKAGPAQMDAYCCRVDNLADAMGGYQLPEEVLMKARPIADYLADNNEQLQVRWLLEAFPGDEWALEGAGIISAGSSVGVPDSYQGTDEEQGQFEDDVPPAPPAPRAPQGSAPRAPAIPQAPRAPQGSAPQAPRAPQGSAPQAPRAPQGATSRAPGIPGVPQGSAPQAPKAPQGSAPQAPRAPQVAAPQAPGVTSVPNAPVAGKHDLSVRMQATLERMRQEQQQSNENA